MWLGISLIFSFCSNCFPRDQVSIWYYVLLICIFVDLEVVSSQTVETFIV